MKIIHMNQVQFADMMPDRVGVLCDSAVCVNSGINDHIEIWIEESAWMDLVQSCAEMQDWPDSDQGGIWVQQEDEAKG